MSRWPRVPPRLRSATPISLDARTAADVVEAAAPRVALYRAAIVAQFGEGAGTLVDSMVLVARATKQAQIDLEYSAPSSSAVRLHREASDVYQLLFTDAQSLANRGLIDREKLDQARDIKGYQPLLKSLLALVKVLREAWPQIQGRTPLTIADVERGAEVALRMSTMLARRDFGGAPRSPEAETRARALSMLVSDYDQVRKFVSTVRWEKDDADAIAPSLWAARSRRPRTDSPVVEDDPNAPTPTPSEDPTPEPGPEVDPTAPGGPFAPS